MRSMAWARTLRFGGAAHMSSSFYGTGTRGCGLGPEVLAGPLRASAVLPLSHDAGWVCGRGLALGYP